MKTKWHERLEQICNKLNMEYLLENSKSNKLIFYCARLPSDEQKKEIKQILPSEFSNEFIEAPKIKTMNAIKTYLIQAGLIGGTVKIIERKFLLDMNCMLEIDEESPIFNKIHNVLKRDGFFDEWEVKIGDIKHSFSLKLSEIINNNIKRDTVISENDITDIQIILNDPKMTWDKLMKTL